MVLAPTLISCRTVPESDSVVPWRILLVLLSILQTFPTVLYPIHGNQRSWYASSRASRGWLFSCLNPTHASFCARASRVQTVLLVGVGPRWAPTFFCWSPRLLATIVASLLGRSKHPAGQGDRGRESWTPDDLGGVAALALRYTAGHRLMVFWVLSDRSSHWPQAECY